MRKEFPARVKAAALKRCSDEKGLPHCEKCGVFLTGGTIRYDHDKSDGLGGEPTLENCVVLCKTCHDEKTFSHDNPIMQDADRARKSYFKVKNRKGRPMPGSKASGIRKRMSGKVERW